MRITVLQPSLDDKGLSVRIDQYVDRIQLVGTRGLGEPEFLICTIESVSATEGVVYLCKPGIENLGMRTEVE